MNAKKKSILDLKEKFFLLLIHFIDRIHPPTLLSLLCMHHRSSWLMDQMEQNHIAQPSAGVDVIYSQEDAAPTSSI